MRSLVRNSPDFCASLARAEGRDAATDLAEELSRLSWSPMFQDGVVLHEYLDKERAEFVVMLGELGLLRRSSATCILDMSWGRTP